MSLLQQDPTALESAAPGEELTKGSGHIIWASVIAAVVVTIAIAVYVLAGQKPPAAVGEATRSMAHFMHRETAEFDANGAPIPKQEFDQVLLFTHIRLHNQSKEPLFLHQITANVTLPGTIDSSYAASSSDYNRLFSAYLDLAPLRGKPLNIEETIPPGQWLEGDFVTSFRLTKAEWDTRKAVDYAIGIRYQPDLKLTPSAPVLEQ
jgi:hypothetical protein